VAAIACAQSGEGTLGEVSMYSGLMTGAMGSPPVFGGTTGLVTKYAVGLVDTSFMPLGSRTLVYQPAPAASSQLFDFNFTVHIQIPVNHQITPYGVFGPALLYNRYQLQTTQPYGPVVFAGQNDFKFGFETGAGLRYYLRDDWGVRTEYRYTISSHNFGRIIAGVFYQFSSSSSWPFLSRTARGRRRGRVF
jgi:hypothetical protein